MKLQSLNCLQEGTMNSICVRSIVFAALISAVTLLGPVGAIGQQKPLKDAVLGTWLVTSVHDIRENGRKNNPWGESVKGTLVFGPDGSFAQVIIGEPRPEMKSGDPTKPDALVVVLLGRYTVDDVKNTILYKVDRGSNSMRNGAEQSLAVAINGDNAEFVGSPRNDQNGTFTPHVEAVRFK
jgi:hypothetical protein